MDPELKIQYARVVLLDAIEQIYRMGYDVWGYNDGSIVIGLITDDPNEYREVYIEHEEGLT